MKVKKMMVMAWLCLVVIASSCSKKDPQLVLKSAASSCAIDMRKEEATLSGIVAAKYLWPNNPNGPIVLRVKFLKGGSDYLRAKVKQYAKEWEKYANFLFEFVTSDTPAEIRISFDQEIKTYVWMIGTYLLDLADDDRYNMHFAGLSDSSSEEEIAGAVLHEFGHVMGLMHEQYHPKAKWDKDYIYTHYKDDRDWSPAEVDENIFGYKVPEPIYSKRYDPESVMHYRYPGKFIVNGKRRLGGNKLSEGDKKFIQRLYPKPKRVQ